MSAPKPFTQTWNPVSGCTPVSEGCEHCYAAEIARRFPAAHGDEPFEVVLEHESRLDAPARWLMPRFVLTPSMGDLFHPSVDRRFLDRVLYRMAESHRHTFFLLTKRAAEMSAHLCFPGAPPVGQNIILAVTAENQARAEGRIPTLLGIPADRYGLSAEPLLGPIDLSPWLWPISCFTCPPEYWTLPEESELEARTRPALSYVIVGPETGRGARPCEIGWIASIVEQCRETRVPIYVKKLPGGEPVPPEWQQLPEGVTL